jgi:hypothetical protein
LWKVIRERKRNEREEVSSDEVESVLEQEAPGILADFDRRAKEGLAER